MSAEQLCRAMLPLLPYKRPCPASVPEYVATHSPKTDYLAPLRTRHSFSESNLGPQTLHSKRGEDEVRHHCAGNNPPARIWIWSAKGQRSNLTFRVWVTISSKSLQLWVCNRHGPVSYCTTWKWPWDRPLLSRLYMMKWEGSDQKEIPWSPPEFWEWQ